MQTITVPQREYKAFQQWRKNIRVHLDERWFWSKEWQRKEATADRAIRKGKMYGPYSDHASLMKALRGRPRKKK